MKLQAARGTQDLTPELCRGFRLIDETALHTAELYGYEEFDTPIFEFSEVFHRTLGETSDVVSKETYTFTDRGEESLTLRPEGTAGIARAFISNGLAQNLPLKFYYSGPMFRYERPQKGRFRQFHQIGVECLGLETPQTDVECIGLAFDILGRLGLEKKIKLELNSLGDPESRKIHREKLTSYLEKFKNDLSADSKIRLEKNPLRILDSKNPDDQKIVAGAPALQDCLNDESKKFFLKVQEGLKALRIPFELNTNLVRGLDYYTHTVFEFTTTELGAQGTVLAGGRYDGLIESMGGPRTPGVGWASGMERLALLLDPDIATSSLKKIALIPADDSADTLALQIARSLRPRNYIVEIPQGGNLGKRMQKAAKKGFHYALIIGETEIKDQSVTVKDLSSGEQKTIAQTELGNYNF
jgi:histidyl-tRNA synthetase